MRTGHGMDDREIWSCLQTGVGPMASLRIASLERTNASIEERAIHRMLGGQQDRSQAPVLRRRNVRDRLLHLLSRPAAKRSSVEAHTTS